MPPKRKREKEPSLLDDLVKWRTSLVRAFKTAKGFERQRLSKRIREIQHPPKTGPKTKAKVPPSEDDAAAKIARLEREVAVLKSIDLHQLAQQTLCSALLKVKGIAESGNKTIDGEVKQGVEEGRKVVEGLDEDMRAALHNVSSGLCNQKQVRGVLEEAVMGTCIRLRVSMPDKKKGKKGERKEKEKEKGEDGEEKIVKRVKVEEEGDKAKGKKEGEEKELVLLKRKRQDPEDGEEAPSDSDAGENGEEDAFEGFSDEEAEERTFAKYDNLLAGSSDESDPNDGEEADSEENEDESEDDNDGEEDEGAEFGGDDEVDERMISKYMKLVAASSDEESDGEGDSDDEEAELMAMLDARAKAMKKRRVTDDDISLSSGDEYEGLDLGDDLNREFSGEESGEGYDYREDISGGSEVEELASEDDEEEEEQEDEQGEDSSDSDAPAPKKAKLSAAAAKATKSGNSAFLPTLMGGYISNSESEASDLDLAPTLKKNRRGQRARQAIWEKKYGAGAKHHSKPKTNSRDDGWDLRKGAVSTGDGGAEEKAGPWKKGIKNPFEKKVLSVEEGLHPERMRAIEGGGNMVGKRKKGDRAAAATASEQNARGRAGADTKGRGGHSQRSNGGSSYSAPAPAPAKPPPVKKRDDEGVLHPSWAAAKKAKEEAGKIEFKGKKVTFD